MVTERHQGVGVQVRETIGRVAAGAIAEKWLKEQYGTKIISWVSSVGNIHAKEICADSLTRDQVIKI